MISFLHDPPKANIVRKIINFLSYLLYCSTYLGAGLFYCVLNQCYFAEIIPIRRNQVCTPLSIFSSMFSKQIKNTIYLIHQRNMCHVVNYMQIVAEELRKENAEHAYRLSLSMETKDL